jgi:hypothetical protein
MTKRRSLESNIDQSAAGSFGSASDDIESLGANHDQTPTMTRCLRHKHPLSTQAH